MRVPDDDLDDFKSRPDLKPDGPAPHAPLRFTGETEILKPIARWEGPIKREADAAGQDSDSSVWFWLSWFHRSLAMGAALSVITFVLGTGIYIAVYGPPSGLNENTSESSISADDLSMGRHSDNDLAPTGSPDVADSLPAADSTFNFSEPHDKRILLKHKSNAQHKTQLANRRDQGASDRMPHQPLRPQFWVSQFVPTTLIIYIERGEVKTRIEPQTITYKKPLVLPN